MASALDSMLSSPKVKVKVKVNVIVRLHLQLMHFSSNSQS